MVARGGAQRIPRPPGTRPGRPAPWAQLDPPARRIDLADVRAALADPPEPAGVLIDVPGAREAAVLVAMFDVDGEAAVLLTKRPETMPSHQGEIAFPGGKREPEDADLAAAALREAREEVGLEPDAVEIVAELDMIGTVASAFTITPFVGLLDRGAGAPPRPTRGGGRVRGPGLGPPRPRRLPRGDLGPLRRAPPDGVLRAAGRDGLGQPTGRGSSRRQS